MLEEKFYSITSCLLEENMAKASIKLNRQNAIFNGHFPEIPIVPGVCSVQMIHELLEKAISKKLMLTEADNIKFLGMMNPDETQDVEIEITYKYNDQGNILTSATITGKGVIFIKFKGLFKC